MAKPETAFWQNDVRPNLVHFGIVYRVENSVDNEGMPDVVYCLRRYREDGPAVSGWIELKHCSSWPVRPVTPLRFKRFTLEQADWVFDWDRMGGKACVLVKVGRDFFLMAGSYAHQLRLGMTRTQIQEKAAVSGTNGNFPTGRVIRWLTEK